MSSTPVSAPQGAGRDADPGSRAAALRAALMADTDRIGMYERDADDRLIYADANAQRIIHISSEQQAATVGRFLERVLPEDHAEFLAARARMRQSDALVRCDYRVLTDAGTVHDVLSWRRRRIGPDGRYAGEIGILFDATDLRTAERRARDHAGWLSLATGAAGMCVWEYGVASRCFVTDEHALQLYEGQLPPSPVPVERFAALLDADDFGRLAWLVRGSPRDGDLVETEFRVRLPSGLRVFAMRGELQCGADGKLARIVGVSWDVTARRRAEAAAREMSERLRLATESAGIGCWQRSLDGKSLSWDEQTYRLFGLTPADGAPLQVLQRMVHPEDLPPLERTRLASLESGRFSIDLRIRRADGEQRWLASRGRRYDDDQGNARYIVGVVWDVTEARVAEQALRAKETAERANLAKSEFLSRMSHELRTPLNAIVGFAQLLEMDRQDPLSATQRERIEMIRQAGWHLLNLINDVLDLARIESGRASVSMQVVDWRAVLEEAMAMVQPQATERGIVLESRSGAGVPDAVWGDPARLRQVLLNLLSNAIKYNRDNGSVLVSVQPQDAQLVFTVRDCGQGMNARQLAGLFQPFNRLGAEMSSSGTGIGLAITQRLLQQMEGAIEVDSTPGVGSEFRVRLRTAPPLSARAVPAPTPAPDGDGAAARRDDVAGTVLCIEDNPANAALVEQFLHLRPKVNLYQAADGATGLVMAAVCRPDLILIDMRLPDLMGDELLQQLRMQPETADIPCVAVSADAMPHDIAQARIAGFDDYWTKPLDAARFLRGIDERLRRPRAGA